MPKKKGKKKFLSDDLEGALLPTHHRARSSRPHVAQEYQDNGQGSIAVELVRDLRPRHQRAVTGYDPYSFHA